MPHFFSHKLGLSWPDYLKVNEIEKVNNSIQDLGYQISSINKSQLATNEQLSRQSIRAIEDSASKTVSVLAKSFNDLSSDLNDINRNIYSINESIQWGFDSLYSSIEEMHGSIRELIDISKKPTQTFAYNWFEIAQDAYRKKLYPEALDALECAINGSGNNLGYKLDYRFHYLKGEILLGNAMSLTTDVIDLSMAKNSFLDSAKYSSVDHPSKCAKSFASAAFAAYLMKDIKESIDLCNKALEKRGIAEAWYLLAKNNIYTDDVKTSFENLKKAILLNKEFAIKAFSDNDFLRYESDLKRFIELLIVEIQDIAKQKYEYAMSQISEMSVLYQSVDVCCDCKKIQEQLDIAYQQIKSNTLFGAFESVDIVTNSINLLERLVPDRKKDLYKRISAELQALNYLINYKEREIKYYNEKYFQSIKLKYNVYHIGEINNYIDYLKYHEEFDVVTASINDVVNKANKSQKIKRERDAKARDIGRGIMYGLIGWFVGGIAGIITGWLPVALFSISYESAIGYYCIVGIAIGYTIGYKNLFY